MSHFWRTLLLTQLRLALRSPFAARRLAQVVLATLVTSAVFAGRLAEGHPLAYGASTFIGFLLYDYFARTVTGVLNLRHQSKRWLVNSTLPPRALLTSVLLRETVPFGIHLLLLSFVAGPVGGRAHSLWLLPAAGMAMVTFTAGAGCLLLTLSLSAPALSSAWRVGQRVFFFATPVVYSAQHTSRDAWASWTQANPLGWMIETARSLFLPGHTLTVPWSATFLAALVLGAFGAFLFARAEPRLRDQALGVRV